MPAIPQARFRSVLPIGTGGGKAFMQDSNATAAYHIWGLDDVVYGPVPLDELTVWTRDERVQPDTWVYCLTKRRWAVAADMGELRQHFGEVRAAEDATAPELRPESLRNIRVLADLSDAQLLRFAAFAEVQPFAAYSTIMRVNTPADCMYFVLSGRVRLRINVKGRELLISLQETGGVFGQISLFDQGPRVTDAIADSEVTTIKVTLADFRRLCASDPEIAVPILLGLGRTLAARIRSDDKHLCEMMAMQQTME